MLCRIEQHSRLGLVTSRIGVVYLVAYPDFIDPQVLLDLGVDRLDEPPVHLAGRHVRLVGKDGDEKAGGAKHTDGILGAVQYLEIVHRCNGLRPAVTHVRPDDDPVAIKENGDSHAAVAFQGLTGAKGPTGIKLLSNGGSPKRHATARRVIDIPPAPVPTLKLIN